MEIEQLCQLIQAVSDSKLTEFSYEEDGVKITMASGTFRRLRRLRQFPRRVFPQRFRWRHRQARQRRSQQLRQLERRKLLQMLPSRAR